MSLSLNQPVKVPSLGSSHHPAQKIPGNRNIFCKTKKCIFILISTIDKMVFSQQAFEIYMD